MLTEQELTRIDLREIKQRAKDLESEDGATIWKDVYLRDVAALLDHIAALEAQERWIPSGDILPDAFVEPNKWESQYAYYWPLGKHPTKPSIKIRPQEGERHEAGIDLSMILRPSWPGPYGYLYPSCTPLSKAKELAAMLVKSIEICEALPSTPE